MNPAPFPPKQPCATPRVSTTARRCVARFRSIRPPLSNQRDLSLAYSPGVAYPCLDIQADPSLPTNTPPRGNLVGVDHQRHGRARTGDIGPLAGKPAMKAKGRLFKKFAGIDVFDIELAGERPRPPDRHHRLDGTHPGRHQSGGYPRRRVLFRRGRSCGIE